MVGLLFHVLYLLGKCIYDRYRVRKTRLLPDVAYEEELFKYDYDALDDDSELENTLWWTHRTIGNFYPPAYIQRYYAVMTVLNEYKGKLWKVSISCILSYNNVNYMCYYNNTIPIQCRVCIRSVFLLLHFLN